MKRAIMLIVLALSLGATSAYADEREERRELRDRRAKTRAAIKRIQKCITSGRFDECAGEDTKIRDLVVAYYMKKSVSLDEVAELTILQR